MTGVEYHLSVLERLKQDIITLDLSDISTPAWLQETEARIRDKLGQQWERNTFYLHYYNFNDAAGRSLAYEIRTIWDDLKRQSSLHADIRRTVRRLATDDLNAYGALCELLAMGPFVANPNRLVDYEPVLDDGRKPEAEVNVCGEDLYIEVNAPTTQDAHYAAALSGNQNAFEVTPDEKNTKSADEAARKISKKANQLKTANRPTLLIYIVGMSASPLADIEGDYKEIALRRLNKSMSAILFTPDCFIRTQDLRLNPGAHYPLPTSIRTWIKSRWPRTPSPFQDQTPL